MSHGETFARLMVRALEREEAELKRLKEEAKNPRQTRDTVREFREWWLWPCFLKEAMREPTCPELGWEKGRADCIFLERGRTVARFELKTFSALDVHTDKQWLRAILEDFEKQLERVRLEPSIEHYVVLLPYGEVPDIEPWIERELMPIVSEKYSNILVSRITAYGPIQLNRPVDGCALVAVFRVDSLQAHSDQL